MGVGEVALEEEGSPREFLCYTCNSELAGEVLLPKTSPNDGYTGDVLCFGGRHPTCSELYLGDNSEKTLYFEKSSVDEAREIVN